jgi:demethylmenaquinone methyltransferase/2-methoxy-6-polyprenyl-1,4-benzoquinol methylase
LRALFDQTAGDYDRIERLLALGSGSWYRRRALERSGLEPGMSVLDVGVGTGLTAREAAALVGSSGQVTGVDPSTGMMARAHLPPSITLLEGRAESLPVGSATVDFISMGYALRHVTDLSAAFCEFRRALKPGGKVCLLEITCPASRVGRLLLKTYMRRVIPCAARFVAHHRDMPQLMRYYWDTIEACAPPGVIMAAMRDAGFIDVRRSVSLGIFSEYCARTQSR